ncbi:MAG: hypothetical protein ACYDCO_04885 [Armatimonadota bacterium]
MFRIIGIGILALVIIVGVVLILLRRIGTRTVSQPPATPPPVRPAQASKPALSASPQPGNQPLISAMRTLPVTASDGAIKALVVEWIELLAQKRFREALAILPYSTEEYHWTPELLQRAIEGYGSPSQDEETISDMCKEWGVDRFEVTTLAGRPDKDEVLRKWIDVDRDASFGLDPAQYLGMVHFHAVPLCGELSDLTARFHIKKVGEDRLTLEFLDLHVM